MSLLEVGQETLSILARGSYVAPSGNLVALRDLADAAVRGTVLHRPADLDLLLARREREGVSATLPHLEITGETTAEAARRLVENEGVTNVAALNFASATSPGGGFLRGAKAQEEDLARCSALYPCLAPQREYYEANLTNGSNLYTDHILYSPDVPFFRDEKFELLERPFVVSIVTAPAPYAGDSKRDEAHDRATFARVLESRARKVLAVCAAHGHRVLILGAWGCGAFHNEPHDAARAFALGLGSAAFAGAFDRVVLAIWERNPDRPNLKAFVQELGVEMPADLRASSR